MSETVEPEAPEETPKRPKKKRKVSFRIKMALLDVIERKRIGSRVDYKAIGHRHRVPHMSLRKTYSEYARGWVDLGDPITVEEKAIDARLQHEKTLQLVRRYKALLLTSFEAVLLEAEDKASNGNVMFWKKDMPFLLRELKDVTTIQSLHEKGYASILEDMMAMSQRQEKAVGGKVVDQAETRVIHANDEAHALAVLSGHAPNGTHKPADPGT